MKIYVAGCGGMLGQAFHHVFGADHELRCTDKDVNESWLSFLDFRDLDAYRKDVQGFRPDVLFHLGAHTDLEYCERNIEDAYLTNTTSVENAVWIANQLDIPLLYISTAGITPAAPLVGAVTTLLKAAFSSLTASAKQLTHFNIS